MRMPLYVRCCLLVMLLAAPGVACSAEGVTSLANDAVIFRVPERHYVVLRRGDVEAVIVDNAAVQDDVLPDHRAGYSGVASLTHRQRKENLFVPAYAGLNFEHILDGTTQPREVLFEPRHEPMELRVVDEHTAELYQRPTRTWGLESCLRYALLEDGTLELTVECIPRRRAFKHGYINLFFASYIHQPESKNIHFYGMPAEEPAARPQWIEGVTPAHGELATHPAWNDERRFAHDDDFPLSLVFNLSRHRYREPWYYGTSHGLALVQMFRPQDRVRLTQSPSGGGQGNPAWDFQWFIEDYEVDRLYRFVMRASYLPFASRQEVEEATARHREELAK